MAAAFQILHLVVASLLLNSLAAEGTYLADEDSHYENDALAQFLNQGVSKEEQLNDAALAETESAVDTISGAFNRAIDKLDSLISGNPICTFLKKRFSKLEGSRCHFIEENKVLELEVKKRQTVYLREVIPLHGLDLKLSYVKYDCTTNELVLETMPSGVQTIIPHFMSINSVTISLKVTMTDPTKTLTLDLNGNWKIGNLNVAVTLYYSRPEGKTEVTATPDKKTTVKNFIRSITGLSLPINPSVKFGFKFEGYIEADGFTTLVLKSDKEVNKFYAIYQKSGKDEPSAKGIVVEVKNLKLSTIIKKVVNLDISRVPFFGHLSVKDLALTWATGKMTDLDQEAFMKSQLLEKLRGRINKGLTAFVKVPFHTDPITITYRDRVLVLTTPKKNLRLDNLLKYLISGGGKWKLSLPSQISNIFKINIERIVINEVSVKVDLSYPKPIVFFKGILSLSNVKVSIIVSKKEPKVTANIKGIIHLAGANFVTSLSRNRRGKYVLTARGDKLNINQLFKRIGAAVLPSVINRFLSRIPFLNFSIIKPRISYTFGVKPLQMELGGTPIIQGFKVTNMDSLIVKLARGTKTILGFELGKFNFASLLKKVTGFNFGRFPILQQEITSTVMISPVTSRTLHFKIGKLASLSVIRGVTLMASMRFPNNCKSDKFCTFAGRLIGHTAVLSLQATISSATYFPITASINNLRLGSGLVLGKAGLEIVGGVSPKIGLVGEVILKKPPLIFAARISVGAKGLSLELSVTNCWNKAFGVRWLDICNLLGSIDFAPPTGITGLAFGAEIHLGYKSSGHQIRAKGYIGVSIINAFENYYYVKFNRITIGSLLKAFKINWKIPRPLAESGFPHGFLNSFSLVSKELPQVHVSIPAGYRIKGTLNILGLQGSADITIGLPKLIDINVALPPIKIGRILAMYASSRDRRRGPYLKAKVKLIPRFYVHIEASGYLRVLGISIETRLKITNTHFEYFIQGRILHLFQASMHITARYGSIRHAQFRVRGEFKLDLFRGIKKIVTNLLSGVARVAKKAFGAAKKLVEKFLKLWKKAKRAVSRLWRKLKSIAGGIFMAKVMEKCINCDRVVIQGWFRRAVKGVGRAVSRTVKGVGKGVSRTVKRVGRAVGRTVKRAGKIVARGVKKAYKFVKDKAVKLYKWIKKAYNKAKKALTRFATKLKNARKYLAKIKNAFKTGLKILDYILRHGLGGIISIRRLWFDVSLGSASIGRFAGGISLRFFGRYNLELKVSFDLRKIFDFAKQLFRKVLGRIKRIFG